MCYSTSKPSASFNLFASGEYYLQFCKYTVSAKHKKAKCNKTRCAYTCVTVASLTFSAVYFDF